MTYEYISKFVIFRLDTLRNYASIVYEVVFKYHELFEITVVKVSILSLWGISKLLPTIIIFSKFSFTDYIWTASPNISYWLSPFALYANMIGFVPFY